MKATTVGIMTAFLLVAGSAVFAAEPQGWKFEVTPYAWLAGIEGDMTVGGQKTDFDRSFSDIVDAVEVGGSLLGVAQYDRYLIWGQVDYFSLSTDEMDVEDRPQGGSLDSKLLLGEFAVGYQIDGWAEGQTFDLLVGVRTLTIENELTVYGKGTFDSDDRDKDSRVDAIFVVRPSIPVFPSKITGLRFNPTLAIGGGDSDLVYEMFPQLQYQFSENVAARVGYRRVGYKLKGDRNDDNELNIALAGMIVGVGVTW